LFERYIRYIIILIFEIKYYILKYIRYILVQIKDIPFMTRKCVRMKTLKCILIFEKIGISKCFTILKKGLKCETLSKLGHFLNY